MAKQERLSPSEFQREARRASAASKKESQKQRLCRTFEATLENAGLPIGEREVQFAPPRRWRADYLYPTEKVIVELHGGIWSKGGHVRGLQFMKDREKVLAAQLLGYLVVEVGTNHAEDGTGAAWVKQALQARGKELSTG